VVSGWSWRRRRRRRRRRSKNILKGELGGAVV